MKGLLTFLFGAAVGAAAAALLTPVTGEELRARIRIALQKRGIIAADNIDELVEMIASQVEEAGDNLRADAVAVGQTVTDKAAEAAKK